MSKMKIDFRNCKEMVPDGISRSDGTHQCSYKIKRDGYCLTHHPESVKARREAADKRYKEKEEQSLYRQLMIANKRIEYLKKLNADLNAELNVQIQ